VLLLFVSRLIVGMKKKIGWGAECKMSWYLKNFGATGVNYIIIYNNVV